MSSRAGLPCEHVVVKLEVGNYLKKVVGGKKSAGANFSAKQADSYNQLYPTPVLSCPVACPALPTPTPTPKEALTRELQ